MQETIDEFEFDWILENREQYINVCGEIVNVDDAEYIRYVIAECGFGICDAIPTAKLIRTCNENITKGISKEETVETLIEKNKQLIELR